MGERTRSGTEERALEGGRRVGVGAADIALGVGPGAKVIDGGAVMGERDG